ncbi:hypothetical protein GFS24_06275 [Chitinophaga sp. SYP-B3965]|uniref:hypothetical protein n=1 Tax=Chitinophaga sp. SYP-B3965 TaxID=2663120 RepID=UPI001299C7C9|nr:hypothetical protein [Chitinophaga sp. SYP-B3965]MRG44710.1 hypothetical protein [Chitinophaga sp. SYP-B3965]
MSEVIENEEADYYSLPVYRDLGSGPAILETDPTCIRRAQEAAKFLDRVGFPEGLLEIIEGKKRALGML